MRLQNISYGVKTLILSQNSRNKNIFQTKSFEGNSNTTCKVADTVSGIAGELIASIKTLLGLKISTNPAVKSTLNKTV